MRVRAIRIILDLRMTGLFYRICLAQSIATTIDLPTHLERRCAERLPKGHGYSEDDLIDRHTLFPFYAFGLPSAREKKLRDAMKGSGNSFIRLSMGIMSGTIPQPQFAALLPDVFQRRY